MSISLFWHLSGTPQFVVLHPKDLVLWLCVYGDKIVLQLPVSIPRYMMHIHCQKKVWREVDDIC